MAGAVAPQSQPGPPSADEEALKMNTDCVYFLASPLTCKKVRFQLFSLLFSLMHDHDTIGIFFRVSLMRK